MRSKKAAVTAASPALTKWIVEGMKEKKAVDITVMDLRKLKGPVCDYFIVCSGTSDTHVKAIADSVEDMVKENLEERVWKKEGMQQANWILLDYASVVVHVFQKETREFYALEELWGDAEIERIAN
jgi:ribosome-associated protein